MYNPEKEANEIGIEELEAAGEVLEKYLDNWEELEFECDEEFELPDLENF